MKRFQLYIRSDAEGQRTLVGESDDLVELHNAVPDDVAALNDWHIVDTLNPPQWAHGAKAPPLKE